MDLHTFRNIYRLCVKELHSLFNDKILILTIVFVYTIVIAITFQGIRSELNNASVAVIDNDRSLLSQKVQSVIIPPYFQHPVIVDEKTAIEGMNKGDYIFVLNIPPNFQKDVENHRETKIQVLVDATSMTQAGSGMAYLQNVITQEILAFLKIPILSASPPVSSHQYILFNENSESAWYSTVMQMILNITLLAIILVGSAVIREKEQGTIEHLLVMPVTVTEISVSKIIANAAVIVIATLLSLYFIIDLFLGIPVKGSYALFTLSCLIYLFSATSMGMLLATLVPSMPQFGLVVPPIIMIANFTSGGVTPVENMPSWVQKIVSFSPTTHFVSTTKDIIFKGADLSVIWIRLLIMLFIGMAFLMIALSQFKKMLEKQAS